MVNGIDGLLKQNVIATLKGLTLEEVSSASFERSLTQQLNTSLQALGYYQAKHQWRLDNNRLIVDVMPGRPVVWGAPHIQVSGPGESLPELIAVQKKHSFVIGQVINHNLYEKFKEELLDTCLRNGYQQAKFTESQLLIDLQNSNAKAILSLQTGPRFKVGAVNYYGTVLSDRVIEQLLVAQPGRWYSRELVSRQYKALLDSGYFSGVVVYPELDANSQVVNVEIRLEDEPKDRYLVGVGASTDTGARLQLSWEKPIVNRRGHSLTVDSEFSSPLTSLSSSYRIPRKHPLKDYYEWVTGWQDKSVEDTDSRLFTTGLNWQLDRSGWSRTLGVNLEHEQYQQGMEPEQSTTYVLPNASWTLSRNVADSNDAYKVWFSTQASATALGSDTDFIRLEAGLKYLLHWNERHAWAMRAEMGEVFSGNFDEVPSSKRFFAGGDQSIRGFGFETISPRNEDGDLVGGNKLITASLEHRWRFTEQWELAGFVDGGKAFNNSSEEFHIGAGIGLRWRLPVGAVGLDLAVPVGDDEFSGLQVHFYMGPAL